MITLYPANETKYDTNGIGMLTDAISCEVTQELNGIYELELKYPACGIHAAEIRDLRIITAEVDPESGTQPFQIYRINPVSSGVITVYARHIAYNLAGIPSAPCSANSAAEAMVAIKDSAATACPFEFWTDKDTAAHFHQRTPKSLWRALGGSEGSVLDTFGGEYEFDWYKVKLWKRRGTDRGATIRYGKDLRTLDQDRSCANVYTGCYPFWFSDEAGLVEVPGRIIKAAGTYDFERIYTLDLSADFQDPPSPEDLEERARSWMKSHHIGEPDISWKVEFEQLEQSEEYRGTGFLEKVLLGDTVHVIFPAMGVNASARAVKTVYDALRRRYKSVTLGRVKQNLADTIIRQNQEIAKKPGRQEITSMVTQITTKLGDALTGALGGAVRVLDTDGDGLPDELYIADNPNPSQAKKVWRFNYEGWAASKSGYNGPFEFGATLADGLLAAAVTAAHLTTGTIQSKDGSFFCDLDNGIFRFKPISDLEADVQDKYDQIAKILRLTDRGILVGEDGSNTELRLDHDVIEILVSGLAAMAIDHSGLFADQITVREIHQGPFTWSISGPHNAILTLS